MKKIIVNTDGCIGCGACVAIDPDHFDFNDDGLSVVTNQDNLESEELLNAIESCPVAVITVEEVAEDKNSNANTEIEAAATTECSDCENCACNCEENEEN